MTSPVFAIACTALRLLLIRHGNRVLNTEENMTKEEELKEGVRAFHEALQYDRLASTREDLVYVEESYWIAYNRLKDSPVEEHRLICAQCLEAVAHILDMEGRVHAGDDLRRQAQAFRKHTGPDVPLVHEE